MFGFLSVLAATSAMNSNQSSVERQTLGTDATSAQSSARNVVWPKEPKNPFA